MTVFWGPEGPILNVPGFFRLEIYVCIFDLLTGLKRGVSMKILTCNMRGYGEGDGENAWKHRKDICVDIIRAEAADIICFQEMMQIADMRASFPDYGVYGMFHEAHERYPRNCIFFRNDSYNMISCSGYWLSENPHVPGSKSLGGACMRLANWVLLEDRAAKTEFRGGNTILTISAREREKNRRLLLLKTRRHTGMITPRFSQAI